MAQEDSALVSLTCHLATTVAENLVANRLAFPSLTAYNSLQPPLKKPIEVSQSVVLRDPGQLFALCFPLSTDTSESFVQLKTPFGGFWFIGAFELGALLY